MISVDDLPVFECSDTLKDSLATGAFSDVYLIGCERVAKVPMSFRPSYYKRSSDEKSSKILNLFFMNLKLLASYID